MIRNYLHINRIYPFLIPVICMIFFVIVLKYFFEFRWHTNDDVVMAMIAHGYGLVFQCSPNLVFSNVIWGYFVQALPNSYFLPGYSLATYLCLIACGSTFIHALWKNGYSAFFVTLVIVLLMTGAIIQPQFTINAGLMMVASVACLIMFHKSQKTTYLIFTIIWAFIAFLIRKEEMMLVSLVALPLLPVKSLFLSRHVLKAFAITFIIIAVAFLIDKQAYQNPSWERHQNFEKVRNYFTDIKIADTFDIKEATLKAHNMKMGDVYLLQGWFFVDPVITDVHMLKSLVDQVKDKRYGYAWLNIKKSVIAFLDIKLIGITTIVVLLIIQSRSYRVFSALLLCVSILVYIGWLGRPGVIRVYVPLMALLVLIPLLLKPNFNKSELSSFMIPVLGIAIFLQLVYYKKDSTDYKNFFEFRNAVTSYNGEPFYVWGGNFPYEKIYPVLNLPQDLLDLKILGMNTSTFSPYSNINRVLNFKNNFSKQIVSSKGVLMYEISTDRMELLNFYCKAHMQGKSVQVETYIEQAGFKLNRYRCI